MVLEMVIAMVAQVQHCRLEQVDAIVIAIVMVLVMVIVMVMVIVIVMVVVLVIVMVAGIATVGIHEAPQKYGMGDGYKTSELWGVTRPHHGKRFLST